MPKVQDLFKRADGSKLLDVKLLMHIKALPTESVEKQTQKGNTISIFPVQLEHQGNVYEWELNSDQMTRIFTKTEKKSGSIVWEGKEGDAVNVWYSSNKSNPTRPYFAAEPTEDSGEASDVMQEAKEVFNEAADGELTPNIPAPVTEKKKFAPFTRKIGEKTEWDGTPRQSSFRQGLAGMIQAMISNPSIDPRSEADIDAILPMASKLVEYVRVHAKKLETVIKD